MTQPDTNAIEAKPKQPKQYQVQMSHGGGSMSFAYFDTLDDALAFDPPQRLDFMGYPKKRPRITIKEFVGGSWGKWKYKKVEGLATITIGRGRVQIKL